MTHLLFVAQAAAAPPSLLMSMMPMILIIGIFYVMVFRPMQKNRKALQQLIDNLKKGDKVVTKDGLYGEVVKAQDHFLVLKLAENVKVRVARWAIAGLEGSKEDKAAD